MAQEVVERDAGLRAGRRWLLAVVCAIAVANVYYAQPLLERIGAELRIPTGQVGLVVGLGQAGYLVGLIVLVPLGDLLPRRVLIGAQLALTAVGTGLAGLAGSAPQLLAGVVVAGLFSTVVQVAVAYTAASSDDEHRGRDIGFVTGGVVVGILLARTVSGVVADVAGWRAVYLGTAVLSLALTVFTAVLLPADGRRPAVRRRTHAAALASLAVLTATDRVFRVRALVTMFLFASFGVLWSGIALPLSAPPWQLSTSAVGLFGLAGLAGALGAARAGRWADRGHGETVTLVALVALAASWAAIAQAPRSLALLVVGIVVLDLAVQAVHVTSQNRIVADRPDEGSRVIGSYMVFYSLGSALGAITTTTLYAAAGWGAAAVAGALYALAALAVWSADRVLGARLRPRSHGT